MSHPSRSSLLSRVIVAHAVAASILSLAFAPSVAATPFVAETAIPTLYSTGDYAAIALDAAGNPRLVGYQSSSGDLAYARKSASGWTRELVASGADVGKYASIALDDADDVYLAYFDETSDDLRYAKRSNSAWTLEGVDATNSVGLYTSIAVDPARRPHIAYYDATTGNLKYARRSTISWTIETVDANAADIGQWTSIALDEQAQPHIAYYDVTNGNLKYAWKLGSSWIVETADGSVNNVGQYASLEVDAASRPAISHYDATTGNLLYTRKVAGAWSTETADASANDVGEFSSLEFAADGSPVIAYWNDTTDEVKFTAKSVTGWSSEVVDGGATSFVGAWIGMALDSQGNAHLAYQNFSPASVKYATSAVRVLSPRGGETWDVRSRQSVSWFGGGAVAISLSTDGGASFETLATGVMASPWTFVVPERTTSAAVIKVERSSPLSSSASEGVFTIGRPFAPTPFAVETIEIPPNAGGWYASLAIDGSGNPRMIYQDIAATTVLRYAAKSGGAWSIEVAASSAASLGEWASLALDSAGNPHACHRDATNGDLKYTRKVGGAWTTETADGSAGDAGAYGSIAIDAAGNPHITYFDGQNGNLKYARKLAGVWTLETADASASVVGLNTSLVLDSSGYPIVSYHDESTAQLRYARRFSTFWAVQGLDNANTGSGNTTSLAVDAQGNSHIAYVSAFGELRHIHDTGGAWTIETVVAPLQGVSHPSLVIDNEGNPRIAYAGGDSGYELFYARNIGGTWLIESIDSESDNVGYYASLELDAQGNPHVGYMQQTRFVPKYAAAAVRVASPNAGVTWSVGSLQNVAWWGVGPVDVSLATDGSANSVPLARGMTSSPISVRVPHLPTRFARIVIERGAPFSSDASDSFFRVDATIALNKFEASFAGGDPVGAVGAEGAAGRASTSMTSGGAASTGVHVTWKTTPAPPEIDGYRLERARDASSAFAPLHAGVIRGEAFVDPSGAESARYRLVAVNGLGEEYTLGETGIATALRPGRLLSVSPNPAPGGVARVAYRVPADGVSIAVDVFDVSGRRIRGLASGTSPAGVREVAWDGRDDDGRDVAAGMYLLRFSRGRFTEATERVVVVR